MNLAVRMMLLGSLLLGSAQAAEQDTAAGTALSQGEDKVAAVRQEPSAGREAKKVHKRARPGAGAGEVKADTQKQERMIANPADTTEQTVQLRGVRG